MALISTITTASRGHLAAPAGFVTAIQDLTVAVNTVFNTSVAAGATAVAVEVSPASIIASGA